MFLQYIFFIITSLNVHTGKPNIISVWAENSVGLVTQKATGTIVIDKTPPNTGNVTCPSYIQVETLSDLFMNNFALG